MIRVAHSSVYKYRLPEKHRFPMEKYDLLPDQLLLEGVLTSKNFFEPKQLTIEDLLLTHSREYWRKLDELSLTAKEIRMIGFPLRKDLIDRGRYIAQGTLDCARYAFQDGVALNIAGGTHHAFYDHGEGFCILNDIAIAANVLLHQKEVKKILIVDLDVHQGNGTAKLFMGNDAVFTFSMHGARNYPVRKENSDLDMGLPDGTDDKTYLKALNSVLPKLIESEKPDLAFYLAGVDVLSSDKLGRLSMTKEGCRERDRAVLSLFRKFEIPVAVCMGGGYSPQIRDIISAHCNTYKMAIDIFG